MKWVGKDLWQSGRNSELHLDRSLQRKAREHALQQFGNRNRLAIWRNNPTEIQQIVDNPAGGIYLLLDYEVVFLDLLVCIRLDEFKIIDGAVDHPQRIAQLVSNSPGQLPECGQFLLADELLLRISQFTRTFFDALLQTGIELEQS